MLAIFIIQIARSAARGPLRSELGQQSGDLRAIDPISALVWAGPNGEFDVGAGHRRFYDLCYFTNAIVFGRDADIKNLIMNGLDRGLECRDKCPPYILDMDDRAPRHAVAFEQHFAAREGVSGQIIQNQIEPDTRGEAVCCRATEEYRRKTVI